MINNLLVLLQALCYELSYAVYLNNASKHLWKPRQLIFVAMAIEMVWTTASNLQHDLIGVNHSEAPQHLPFVTLTWKLQERNGTTSMVLLLFKGNLNVLLNSVVWISYRTVNVWNLMLIDKEKSYFKKCCQWTWRAKLSMLVL